MQPSPNRLPLEAALGQGIEVNIEQYIHTVSDPDGPLQRGSTDLVEPGPRRAKDMMEGGNLYSPTVS